MSKKKETSPAKYPYISEFKEFINEFKNESDRAAVILGAAKLDYLLYQVLFKFLLPNPNNNDELLSGDSPLSTFSAKINMSYRLGLIDSEFSRALHLIRKIRNAFAHEMSNCKLDSGPHRDRVRELISSINGHELYKNTKNAYFNDKSGPSADFFTALAMMIVRLESIFHHLDPLKLAANSRILPLRLKDKDSKEVKSQRRGSAKKNT
jgi:DNA-binding MltR family transcriptional regulator